MYFYFSRIVPNQITENINIHEYWYLYRNCLDTLPSNGWKIIYKEREKTKKVCFKTTTNKFERLSHNLMENIEDPGRVINRFRTSTVAASRGVV